MASASSYRRDMLSEQNGSQETAGLDVSVQPGAAPCPRSPNAASSDACALGKLAGMCKNPQVDTDGPAVTGLMADVAAVVSRHAAAVSEDVYAVILREVPELRDDRRVLALL